MPHTVSTVPAHRVLLSGTMKSTSPPAAGISVCWNVQLVVLQWWTRPSAMVDTVCRNGGHGVLG
ncbi:hypothetical protein [Kibdelosporangium philippinense]|uniref:hypothetical protein n=1 Tax=Kibdelosporangium philippinense TaxID=211113 RepID=UPI00361E77FC